MHRFKINDIPDYFTLCPKIATGLHPIRRYLRYK